MYYYVTNQNSHIDQTFSKTWTIKDNKYNFICEKQIFTHNRGAISEALIYKQWLILMTDFHP